MANEPFSIKKWFSGFINPTTWSKGFVYFFMIAIIIVVCLTVYRAYFMKTGSNVSKPWVIALPGSTVSEIDMSSTQKIDQKRPWWYPIPFVEVFGGVRNKEAGSLSFETEYGARCGVRWDF